MNKRNAFSLVEVMVAMAVFAMLAVILVRMVGAVSAVILNASKSLDADSEARLVFGLLDRDLSGMLNRRDVDIIFKKVDQGNDEIYFLSSAPASNEFDVEDQSSISLVGYRIGQDPNLNTALELQRLGLGLAWADFDGGASARDNVVFLTQLGGSSVPEPNSTIPGRWGSVIGAAGNSTSYAAVGPQVFRFEFSFLLQDGTYSNYPVKNNGANSPLKSGPPSSGSGTIGDRWYDASSGRGYIREPTSNGAGAWRAAGLQDVSSIVVALGILDQESRKILPASDTSMLPALLSDVNQTDLRPTNLAQLPKTRWQQTLDDPGFTATAGIPPRPQPIFGFMNGISI